MRIVIEFKGATAVIGLGDRRLTVVRLGGGWVTASGAHRFDNLEAVLIAMGRGFSDVAVSS